MKFDPSIDPLQLDTEWVNQPRLYYTWARKLADARRDLDEAKNELKVIEAETGLAIRKSPDAFGIVKLSEKAIEQHIPVQSDVRAALATVVECRHSVEVLCAAVFALDNRKKALEKLVELHLANYFATPKVANDAGDVMAEAKKKHARRGSQRPRKEADE